MSDSGLRDNLRPFYEQVGVLFEQWGLPLMAGRIFGFLIVCEPPHQSANQLGEELKASKGSISTATRMLIQAGLIERIAQPGQRGKFYRLADNPGRTLLESKMSGITVLRKLFASGLELMKGESEESKRRLQQTHDLYAFFEREMPKLLVKYSQECLEKGEQL